MKKDTELKPGDWVKLLKGGMGFVPELVGEVARVKLINDNDDYNLNYDIILDSASNIKLKGEQCAGEAKYHTKGCSSKVLTKLSRYDIEQLGLDVCYTINNYEIY